MSGGSLPLFVEYLASVSPLRPMKTGRHGCEMKPFDSEMSKAVSQYDLRTYGLQVKPASFMASLTSHESFVVRRKASLLPSLTWVITGLSASSFSPFLILASRYSF